MDDLDPFALHMRSPTAARPLLGLTVLVVEDSRYASEAMRLLCLRSGARIRRADSLRSAHRHLQVYSPSVALVDLGLRDGSGADLIREMGDGPTRTSVIIGVSGDPDGRQIALDAGADAFLAKPVSSLAEFQEVILSLLPAERRPTGPRTLNDETIKPDPIAYQDDLALMADMLSGSEDDGTVAYVSQFLAGIARSAEDKVLLNAVERLEDRRNAGRSTGSEFANLAGILQSRLEEKIAM